MTATKVRLRQLSTEGAPDDKMLAVAGGLWVLVDPPAGGAEGASAYEVAVAHGFVGDEAAWLASLQGADGTDGTDGTDGLNGATGITVQDENGTLGAGITQLDFQGAGVGAALVSGEVVVTIPGYSDEQVRDVIGAALVQGTGITLTVNDAGDTITIAATGSTLTVQDENTTVASVTQLDFQGAGVVAAAGTGEVVVTIPGYTDEQARDAIGAALVQGTGVTITVNDAGDTITIAATATGNLRWLGAWNNATNYVPNDVVSSAYSLWVAIANNVNSDPATLPSANVLGANTTAVTTWGNTSQYQTFTVNANTTITKLECLTYASGGGQNNVGTTLYVADHSSGTVLATGTVAAGVTLGNWMSVNTGSVTLVPGTTYRFGVTVDPGGQTSFGLSNAAATLTGTLASCGLGTVYTSYRMSFRLDGSLSSWQKLAQAGNRENVGQVGASGAAVTIADPEWQSITRVVLTANCTITLPTVVSGASFTVVVVQDATGSRTLTWAGPTVRWPGGVTPTQTATALKGDVYSFMADGSGNWIGFVAGQNY